MASLVSLASASPQPPMNEEHKNHFVYNDTKMILSGKIKFLDKSFVVDAE